MKDEETYEEYRKKARAVAMTVVIAGIFCTFFILNYMGILRVDFPFKLPSGSSKSQTTTTTIGESFSFTPTGAEILRNTVESPSYTDVDLECGRYALQFVSGSDVKLSLYKGAKFKATNGAYEHASTFKFDVNHGEDGLYTLKLYGESEEVSILLTQESKF